MNIPIKIKNKKPWLLLKSYKELLIDDVDFSNYQVSEENAGPENYFGKAHIDNMIEALNTKYPNKTQSFRDTLENLFNNIDTALEACLDYLYLTNPVESEDTSKIDILLENSINKLSVRSPQIWRDKLIKEDLILNLSSSFLGYDIQYNPDTKLSEGNVYFKYLPEGSENKVTLNLKTNLEPDTIDIVNPSNNILGDLFLDSLREDFKLTWNINFGWKEPLYQEELYRSIMSNIEPLTIDSFYVKSYNYSKYNNLIYPNHIESGDNFSNLSNDQLNNLSSNIIYCLSHDKYNLSTVNPGFKLGLSGWNRVSANHNKNNSSQKVQTSGLVIQDTNQDSTDFELTLDKDYNKISQTLRVPEGRYELNLSMKTNFDRDIKVFLGDTEISLTLTAGETFKRIKLTDIENGGLEITSENKIVEFGFEILEDSISSQPEISVEYCRFKKLS